MLEIMIIIMNFMWMFSIMLMFLTHPLSIGLILLIQTTLTSILMGMLSLNYWFSYILFLIMIGGMLILFIYMTSVASNEKFQFSYKLLMLFLIMLCLMLLFMLVDHYYFNLKINTIDMIQNNKFNFKLSINKYMNYPQNLLLFTMILYLFITLIMVVKITNIHYGPLRQKY